MRTWTKLAALVAIALLDTRRVAAFEERGRCEGGGQCIGCHVRGFPIVIDKPGSYRLCRNLVVADANTTAIRVEADGVTIDLDGYTISGPTVCTPGSGCAPLGSGIGISAEDRSGLAVRNGTVRGMGSVGILAGDKARIERVNAIGNGGDGIQVRTAGIVVGNLAAENGRTGISGQEFTSFRENVSHDNGGRGIMAGCACSVIGNLATNNAETGITTGGWTACVNNTAAGNAQGQIGGCDAVKGSNVCNYDVCP